MIGSDTRLKRPTTSAEWEKKIETIEEQILQNHEIITNLEKELEKKMKKGAKVKVEPFDRTRSKLKGFLVQLDVYFYIELPDTPLEQNIRTIRFMTRAVLQQGQIYLDSQFNFRKEN